MKFSQMILYSFLTWVVTCLLGSGFHRLNQTIGLRFHEILVISLIFSFPAFLFLIPNFYLLHVVLGRNHRILYSLVSILVLSAIVILLFAIFTKGYPFEEGLVVRLLTPYIVCAQLSFLLIAHKFILIKE